MSKFKNAHQSEYGHFFCLLCVSCLAIYYRFDQLDRYSLWSDELWGVVACSQGSWSAMLHDLIYNDNHPPGYQTILYFFMRWFGHSDFIIRLPSVIAGVLTVFATYLIGRQWFSIRSGLMAALLVAGSYQAIYYSQEARAYSLLMLACLLSAYYFIQLFVYERVNNSNTLLFSITGVASAYLHYVGVVFLCVQALLLVIFLIKSQQKRVLWMAAVYGFALIFLLYFRWLPVLYQHMTSIEEYWVKAPDSMALFNTFFSLFGSSVFIIFFCCAGIFSALFFMSNKKSNALESKIIWVLLALSCTPVLVFFVKSLSSQPVYNLRHFVFSIPLLSLVSACGIDKFFKNRIKNLIKGKADLVWIAIFLIIILFQWLSNKTVHQKIAHQDFKSAANIVNRDELFIDDFQKGRSSMIVSHTFFYHYIKFIKNKDFRLNVISYYKKPDTLINRVIKNKPDAIYLLEISGISSGRADKLLSPDYFLVKKNIFSGVHVHYYRRL